eukprot:1095853-Rhodomonas_salina.1
MSGPGIGYAYLPTRSFCDVRYWHTLCCYTMSGTDIGYAGYAATDMGYAATDIGYAATDIGYAATDIGYAATRQHG